MEEKKELVEINQRFIAYIHRVQQLKDESDIKIIYQTIDSLENEIKSLKSTYETQVAELRNKVDFFLREKIELERSLAAKKSSETHLLDRLNVESSKNLKIVQEVETLQRALQDKEQQMKGSQNEIKQAWLDFGELQNKHTQLQVDFDQAKQRIKDLEQVVNEYEVKVQALENKLAYEVKFSSGKIDELKVKIEKYVSQLAEMALQVQDAKEKEARMPEIVKKVKADAERDLEKFKTETEGYFRQTLTSLQYQLECESKDKKHFQQECEKLGTRILELRKKEADLDSQVQSLQYQREILEETMKVERQDNAKHIANLETKLRDLQEEMLRRMREISSKREDEVQFKNEIRNLQDLLSAEEKRLRINHLISSNMNEEKVSETPTRGIGFEDLEQKMIQETTMNEKQQDTDVSIIKRTDSFSLQLEFTEEQTEETVQNNSQFPETPRPSAVKNTVNNEEVDNSIEPTTTEDNIKDKNVKQNGTTSETQPKKEKKSKKNNDDKNGESLSNATTDLKILEMNKDGKCVVIYNSNETKEADFSGIMIQQCIGGHPVAAFRFPRNTRVPASSSVTVWAACNDPLLHQPPTSFYWPELPLWNTGPECTTLLCNQAGETIAWMATAHRISYDPYFISSKSKSENLDNKLPELPNVNKHDSLFMRKEKTMPVYSPSKHPHGSHPLAPIHPCTDTPRGYTWGNDNSSLNRQSRSQTMLPDATPGEPYAGVTYQTVGQSRIFRQFAPSLKRSGTFVSRSTEVLLRAPIGPPSPFMKPHNRFAHGMHQIQSVQHLSYQPPAPRTIVAEW